MRKRPSLCLHRLNLLLQCIASGLLSLRKRRQLSPQRLRLLVNFLVLRVDRRLLSGNLKRKIIRESHSSEERSKPVMICLRKRIVFVVVTAAARHRQSQKRRARRLGDVRQQLRPTAVLFIEKCRSIVLRAEPQIAGRDQTILLDSCLWRTVQQLIPGELLADKLIERLVGVERTHNIVAEPPRLRAKLVPIKTVAVAIPDHVEPQPRKVLTKPRAGQ